MDVVPPQQEAVQRPALSWYLTEPARGALAFGSLPLASRGCGALLEVTGTAYWCCPACSPPT